MADEKNIVDDEDEFAVRHNPYAQLPSNSSKTLHNAPIAKHSPKLNAIGKGARKVDKGEIKPNSFKNTMKKIGDYILNDVLIPTGKDVIANIITNSTDMILYKGERRSRRSYSSYYRRSSSDSRRDRDRDDRDDRRFERRRRAGDWEDIFLPDDEIDPETGRPYWDRVKAENVISTLYDNISDYGRATVADLFDLTGISAAHTDENRGWEKGELRGACVRKVSGGFLIITPDPKPLERD